MDVAIQNIVQNLYLTSTYNSQRLEKSNKSSKKWYKLLILVIQWEKNGGYVWFTGWSYDFKLISRTCDKERQNVDFFVDITMMLGQYI